MPTKKRPAVATSYDKAKEHKGRRYTGMKVGGHHTWDYDKGVWKEKKVAPDRWEIRYATDKRRRGRAPKGSGAAVGTAYDWLIVARQKVVKLDANTYSTELEGLKYKLAHKRAGAEAWSVKTEKGMIKREIALLEGAIERLKARLDEDAKPAAHAAHHAKHHAGEAEA